MNRNAPSSNPSVNIVDGSRRSLRQKWGKTSPQIRINKGSATDPIYAFMLKSLIHGRLFSSYHKPIFQLKQSNFGYQETLPAQNLSTRSRGTSLASEPGLELSHSTRPTLEPEELCRFVSLSIIKGFR